MAAQGRGSGEWRRIELQLDTAQILLVFAMLLGLCATSFYLGRWIERDRWSGSKTNGNSGSNRIAESDAGAGLTFFDTLGGKQGSRAEPGRQARPAREALPAANVAPGANADVAEGPVDAPGSGPAPAAAPFKPEQAAGAPSTAAIPTPARGVYAVQVFSGDRAQAEKIVGTLSRKGYAAKAVPVSPGSSVVRVRLYGYKTRADATKAADRVKKEARLSAWVVKAD